MLWGERVKEDISWSRQVRQVAFNLPLDRRTLPLLARASPEAEYPLDLYSTLIRSKVQELHILLEQCFTFQTQQKCDM